MTIFLVPLGILEAVLLHRSGVAPVDWLGKKPNLRYPVIVHVLIAGVAWAGNVLFWVIGLQYTSTVRSVDK